MTGFGAASGRVGAAQVTVELRTVNHRFFNANIKLPSALSRWEGDVRETLRKGITRGHVSLSARVEREAAGGASIDEARFAGYVTQLRQLAQRTGLPDPDIATVMRLPDVITSEASEEAGNAAELTTIVQEALDGLMRMRVAEGARLAQLLTDRIDEVSRAVDRLAARAPERLVAERDRLRLSVAQLTEGLAVDEQRLAQEIALLADRLDVSEEVDRFRAHIDAFRSTLAAASPDGVGKRLGFLLQEMLREANTTGSKARDALMTHDVVAAKEELERIAEQVENVE
jgi:uncharacterized protein (TIGR00255 family)